MLKSEHLEYTQRGGRAFPKFAKPEKALPWAEAILGVIKDHKGLSRGHLDEALLALEGDSPDYTLLRGLAHLALGEAEFETQAPTDPELLRKRVFGLAEQQGEYGGRASSVVLEQVAADYGLEAELLRSVLYGDLEEHQTLTKLPDLSPQELLERYNLAQAQGLLYSATSLVIQAHRNTVGEYKKLFKYLKLYQLMFAVEGDLDSGYRITIDGPASLFQATRRYGIRMAALLPALLNISKWEFTAQLYLYGKNLEYSLDSSIALVTHYPKPPEFDSMLEATFAKRWEKLHSVWRLEREVEVVDLKGTVFLPDFALRHPDGRTMHFEIVGFWQPEYLRRKLEKVQRANMNNLILAVSRRLSLGDDDVKDLPAKVLWFKGQIKPESVLETLEQTA